MFNLNIPPEYGLFSGPMIVASHSSIESPVGPADTLAGGSFVMSFSSF